MEKDLISLKKKDKKLQKEFDIASKAYEKAKAKANCGLCPIYQREIRSFGLNRHQHCENCPKSGPVLVAYNHFLDTHKQLDQFEQEVYAKAIYDQLSHQDLMLLVLETKKEVKFAEAFGKQYEDNIPGKRYRQLIFLYEKKGGKYKLK